MTYRETTLGELSFAQIPHTDLDSRSGLPEIHLETETGWRVLLAFDREGHLLAVDVEPTGKEKAHG